MEIKNLKKAAERILSALKNKEKIIIYGDADLDGISSAVILEESIKNLNGRPEFVYFPDREIEGYGINATALNFLKKFAPALFLALDCGISNFREVEMASRLGFEVVIIDHHEVLDKLPQAPIIVDPKQKGDPYPFKKLANAGVVFRLSRLLLGKEMTDSLRKNFLELVALATIADMMPEEEDNKIMIEEGLSSLENTWRPGLRVFFKINQRETYESLRMSAQKIIAALNVSEVRDHSSQTYLLLRTDSEKTAQCLAENLLAKRRLKEEEIKSITAEVEERFLKKIEDPFVFEGSFDWPLILLGSVASRICHRYQKPVFVYRQKEKISQGAVRTPAGVNGVEAMKKCSERLITYGGHAQAAGFTIKNEDIEKFKNCLMQYFKRL